MTAHEDEPTSWTFTCSCGHWPDHTWWTDAAAESAAEDHEALGAGHSTTVVAAYGEPDDDLSDLAYEGGEYA